MSTIAPSPEPATTAPSEKYPKLALGVWHGLPISSFCRLMLQNRCSFSWQRTDRMLSIFFSGFLNSGLNLLDRIFFAHRAEQVRLPHPPLFIIGHWRTGTTLLHELLVRDEQFTCPTTFRCLAPGHFLLTERVLPKLLGFLLPQRRPMDNMPVGWKRPQEDEFALCNQGIPSPYLFWMYSDRECPYDNYLDLEGLSPRELRDWKQALSIFLKRITLRDPRRIVLKSPTHTARVSTLLEMFPDAQFIHLTRDPEVMIPSTIRTWRRMSDTMGLRVDHRPDMDDYVLANFRRLDEALQRDRSLVPEGQFLEMRYEDLTADMVARVEEIYAQLNLGDFEAVRPHLQEYLRDTSEYRTNRFSLDEPLRGKIHAACGDYSRRHGYA